MTATLPFFRVMSYDIDAAILAIRQRLTFSWFLPRTKVEVTVGNFSIPYRIGTLQERSALLQPPSITVDPPLFAFKEEASRTLAPIRGRLAATSLKPRVTRSSFTIRKVRRPPGSWKPGPPRG